MSTSLYDAILTLPLLPEPALCSLRLRLFPPLLLLQLSTQRATRLWGFCLPPVSNQVSGSILDFEVIE
jgi:hypothetical protein